MLGQFSVQAIDLSHLAITIVTFNILAPTNQGRAVGHLNLLNDWSPWILSFIWVYPFLTSVINLHLVGYDWFISYFIINVVIISYGPVGNCWCWIDDHPMPEAMIVRYVLTHALRIVTLFLIC